MISVKEFLRTCSPSRKSILHLPNDSVKMRMIRIRKVSWNRRTIHLPRRRRHLLLRWLNFPIADRFQVPDSLLWSVWRRCMQSVKKVQKRRPNRSHPNCLLDQTLPSGRHFPRMKRRRRSPRVLPDKLMISPKCCHAHRRTSLWSTSKFRAPFSVWVTRYFSS